ncbi:hypothetical protein COV17_00220 [Candidatus Woesearchaeota archaeon CG10_big_fil_rev_8_21_14_0_10_36_11]|nr:MAG: hypothetical protein COV17_00220 [Candidatus Woesearchaeota archaeon CG10_big_fil_rev_8_21_14_0_10_36_11]
MTDTKVPRTGLEGKLVAGVNGFGRFGLHLLKHWLDRRDRAHFDIRYINDPVLTIDDAARMIKNDPAVNFFQYKFKVEGDRLLVSSPHGTRNRTIVFTNAGRKSIDEIPWVGDPDIVFECSGGHAEYSNEARTTFLRDRTKNLVISATAPGADKTLVFGFNHEDFDQDTDLVTSYGSCTVNAFVPLAQWMHDMFSVVDADVHVAHNMPEYKLKDPKNQILYRKECTLEVVGPKLLSFLPSDRFLVDYIVCPFTNISGITFRFGLVDPVVRDTFIDTFRKAVSGGALQGLYGLEEVDVGDSNRYKCTPFSTVFTEDTIEVRGSNVYLKGYFDNENSVNRYFDLVDYMAAVRLGRDTK